MKKIILAVMAVAAISFTSCGNKTQQADAADSTAVEQVATEDVAQGTLEQLAAALKAGDAAKLQEVLASVKEKAAAFLKENPEVAKEYVAKVQAYLKENAEQIKSLAGDNAAIQAAVSAITEAEPEAVVNSLLEQVGDKAAEVKDAAVDAANQKVEDAKDAAKQKAEDAKDAAKQKAAEAVDNAASSVKKGLGL